MIYVIACDTTHTMKIGFTGEETPEKRLHDLQTSNPFPLRIIACCIGDRTDERELHVTMAEHQIRGEWFWMDDASLDALEASGVFACDAAIVPGEAFQDFMPRCEAAAMLLVSEERLRAWEKDGGGPPFEMRLGRPYYREEGLRAWQKVWHETRPRYRSSAEWLADKKRNEDPDLRIPQRDHPPPPGVEPR